MKLLKKDWLFDIKFALMIGMAILVSFAALIMIMGKVLGVMPIDNAAQVYNKTYGMIALVISFYPVMAFKGVCPQLGSDKLYMATSNLPMSRKQVFFKGLKPWLIITPIVLVGCGLGCVYLNFGSGALEEVLFISLFTPILMILFSGIIQLKIMAGSIFTLAKQIKGYKVVQRMVLFDFVVLVMISAGIRIFNIDTAHDMWWMVVCCGLIFLESLIMFLVAWRDIEKVYQ